MIDHRSMSRAVMPVPVRTIGLALLSLICFGGCPEAQIVSVTIKPDAAGGAAQDAAAGASADTPPAGYGNLVGTITLDGPARSLPPLVAAGDATAKDAAICSVAAVPDESLVVNGENNGIANVIVFLEKRPAFVKPELAKPPADPVMFDQKGCRFLPHVLTVQVGQPLLVISDDGIPHNTHTFPKRNEPFNKVIGANDRSGVPCNYKKSEPSPVGVSCDYHPWMKAYHFPLDHPYFAITDKDGKFKIEGLPPGKHAFNIWHERAPGDAHLLERKLQITIEIDKDTTKDLTYGGAKFAALPAPARRQVAFERIKAGGEITVSQTERLP